MITIPNISFHDAIGLIGVAMYVFAYTGVQLGAINGNRVGYTCLNGLAAGCVLFSMISAGNLFGILVSGVFLIFSLIGIARKVVLHVKYRRRVELWATQNLRASHLSSR